MAGLKVTQKKEKPKFRRGQKVVVSHRSYKEVWLVRYGYIKGILSAKAFTRRETRKDIKRGWLLSSFLEERVNQAEDLYDSPWVYLVEYTDKKYGAGRQYLSHRDIRKATTLDETLFT